MTLGFCLCHSFCHNPLINPILNEFVDDPSKAFTKSSSSFNLIFWASSCALTLSPTYIAVLAFVTILTLIITCVPIFVIVYAFIPRSE